MITFHKEHIPNYISAFRILLVPVYVLFFCGVVPEWNPLVASGAVLFLAGVSDLADGYLARRNHWISDAGKLLDPFADKLMELAVTICLATRFRGVFFILAGITVIKEAVMIVSSYIILKHGKVAVFSAWYGKAATLAWFLTVFTVSFVPAAPDNDLWCHILCLALIAFMAFAFVMYVVRFRDAIAKTWRELRNKNDADVSLKEAEESK